jgi:hypothetical protein
MCSQSYGRLDCWNFGIPTSESWDKKPFGCGPMESCIIYYMGEGGGFPRIWVVVNLVSPELPVACLSTKGVPKSELTNLWLVECRFE